jgi:hypothetical protein
MTGRVRRAGARWRLLVHQWRGKAEGYGTAHDLRNYPNTVARPLDYTDAQYAEFAAKVQAQRDAAVANGWSQDHDLSGTEFDELVVGNFLHVEQMDTGLWWSNIGGITLWVRVDRDGRPKHVTVYGPGDYAGEVEGCGYELVWSANGGTS